MTDLSDAEARNLINKRLEKEANILIIKKSYFLKTDRCHWSEKIDTPSKNGANFKKELLNEVQKRKREK